MSASNYFSKLVILVLQSSNNTVLCMLGVGMAVLGAQSWPTLWDPMDCSSPGSSIHGILQVRMLEWVAIPFSRGSCPPRNPSWVSCTAGRFFTDWATSLDNYIFSCNFIFKLHLCYQCTKLHLKAFSLSHQRRQWHPTPVLLSGKSHGRRSLVGCSPWGHYESDTTERLHFLTMLSSGISCQPRDQTHLF